MQAIVGNMRAWILHCHLADAPVLRASAAGNDRPVVPSCTRWSSPPKCLYRCMHLFHTSFPVLGPLLRPRHWRAATRGNATAALLVWLPASLAWAGAPLSRLMPRSCSEQGIHNLRCCLLSADRISNELQNASRRSRSCFTIARPRVQRR